jgi:hypothetical protein
VHLFPTLLSVMLFGALQLAIVRVFIPQSTTVGFVVGWLLIVVFPGQPTAKREQHTTSSST